MKFWILLTAAITLLSCKNNSQFKIDREYLTGYEKKIRSIDRMVLKYRWMVGMFELDPNSSNHFGSGPDCQHRLDIEEMPSVLGSIEFAGDSLIFHTPKDISVSTINDSVITDYHLTFSGRGHSDEFHYRNFGWSVTSFVDKYFLRVKDTLSPAASEFKGFERYDPTPDYIFEAHLSFYDYPKVMEVPTVFGLNERVAFVGAVSFKYKGQVHTLQYLEGGFIMFGDETSGDETYGAGRYLLFKVPSEDGAIVLDFNYAVNPPCRYSDFTTCTFPPEENWLPFKVMAGEKTKRLL
jgi:uncharacterized protein